MGHSPCSYTTCTCDTEAPAQKPCKKAQPEHRLSMCRQANARAVAHKHTPSCCGCCYCFGVCWEPARSVYVYLWMSVVCTCAGVCVCMQMCECVCVHMCLHVCMCVCVRVRTCVYDYLPLHVQCILYICVLVVCLSVNYNHHSIIGNYNHYSVSVIYNRYSRTFTLQTAPKDALARFSQKTRIPAAKTCLWLRPTLMPNACFLYTRTHSLWKSKWYTHVHIHTYVYTRRVYTHIRIHTTCVYTRTYTHMRVYTHVHIHTRIYIMCVCTLTSDIRGPGNSRPRCCSAMVWSWSPSCTHNMFKSILT